MVIVVVHRQNLNIVCSFLIGIKIISFILMFPVVTLRQLICAVVPLLQMFSNDNSTKDCHGI